MGANAQTTVQKFLSGAVLTAEQQNFSAATGVPVFATTVTRDAAFGGANKVLAEGQTCYLESTNVVQYYDGAAWATVGPAAAAKVLQIVTGNTTTSTSTSSNVYADTTLTATITPTSASSTILVFIQHSQCEKSAGSSSNQLNVELQRSIGGAGFSSIVELVGEMGLTLTAMLLNFGVSSTYLDSPASVAAIIYKTRFKNDANGASVTVQKGSFPSTIILMEIAA